jgi:hypothetical protein
MGGLSVVCSLMFMLCSFLVSAPRYDSLLAKHSQKELDDWKLVRVSERFRIFALGLPVRVSL